MKITVTFPEDYILERFGEFSQVKRLRIDG